MKRRPKFKDAIAEIADFVMPVAQAAAVNRPFNQIWQPELGWQPSLKFSFKDYQGDRETPSLAAKSLELHSQFRRKKYD